MHDSELKKILQETCPVRPGQEERAWVLLRERLQHSTLAQPRPSWLHLPTWRGALAGFAVLCCLVVLVNVIGLKYHPLSFASADSEAPGIFATSYYSSSAQAQVVWLDGLGAASDKPTYLDPTTILHPATNPQPGGAQDSL